MPNGYTNDTRSDRHVVVKNYAGPDRARRMRAERHALTGLSGQVPVPALLDRDASTTTTAYVEGRPGQDGFAGERARRVLAACGEVLRTLHGVDPATVFGGAGAADAGQVIVHGDFGPNNVVVDESGRTVVAVVDWEFSHPGDPVEDLAWCEWIVRTHHPECTPLLAAFFAAYGGRPDWERRRAAMLSAHERLIDFCHRWDPDGAGVRRWRERLADTRGWTDFAR